MSPVELLQSIQDLARCRF